jgi:hypothetical protein
MYPYFFSLLHSLISHLLKHIRRRSHFLENGAFILVEMKGMFLHTFSVEAAHICGVYVILILGE